MFNTMHRKRLIQIMVVVSALLVVTAICAADEQPNVNSNDMFAAVSSSLPSLTASQFDALPAAESAENKGGCWTGCLSTGCIGIPAGQVQNSGYNVPVSRVALRVVTLGLYDGYQGYKGETAEEYVGDECDDIGTALEGADAGGPIPGAWSCLAAGCAGIPGGHLKNSGYTAPKPLVDRYKNLPAARVFCGPDRVRSARLRRVHA
ncbi:MAG: hypothetical protein R6V19_02135 [Armatimonadota bacterium]